MSWLVLPLFRPFDLLPQCLRCEPAKLANSQRLSGCSCWLRSSTLTALWDMRCPRYLSVLHCDSRTACSRFSGDAYCSKSLLPFSGLR